MVCIFLCAGYATRMYPLTENFPKSLLEVKGKTILDYLYDDLKANTDIKDYVVVSNHKFYDHFLKWGENKSVKVIDDGSTTNDNRLGAVKDILFAIESLSIDDDILVLAADNLLDFSLASFVSYFKEKNSSCIMRYKEENIEKLKRTGNVLIDENELVLEMREKRIFENSYWAVPPFYIFKKDVLQEFKRGIESGCKVDAPGNFIEWFSTSNKLHAFLMPGTRFDIGNLETYYSIK